IGYQGPEEALAALEVDHGVVLRLDIGKRSQYGIRRIITRPAQRRGIHRNPDGISLGCREPDGYPRALGARPNCNGRWKVVRGKWRTVGIDGPPGSVDPSLSE